MTNYQVGKETVLQEELTQGNGRHHQIETVDNQCRHFESHPQFHTPDDHTPHHNGNQKEDQPPLPHLRLFMMIHQEDLNRHMQGMTDFQEDMKQQRVVQHHHH